MLRIFLLQNLYDMADDKTVAEVIDSRAFSDFCGVDSTIIEAPSSVKNKEKKREHGKLSIRVKVEHVFGVVKGQLKYKKTRYRGLRKQEAKFNIMFALANLILADRPCLAV